MRTDPNRRRGALALSILLATIAGGAGPAAGGPAEAATLACGQVVTLSVSLSRDLGPCESDGIIVGADNITIDLRGHRVFGTTGPGDNVGIRMNGRTGVTVMRGIVTDFGAGVVIQGGSRNTVSSVTIDDNVGPIDGSGDFGDGVAIFGSAENLLENSVVRHNGPFDGVGVFGAASVDNRIVGNLVEDNNISRYFRQLDLSFTLDDGINLGAGLDGGSRTTIQGNTIRGNGLDGIDACSNRGNPCITTDNVIVDNLVVANGFGDPANASSEGNFDGDGIHVVNIRPPGRDPSDFVVPTGNLVARNRVLNNAGNGISVGNPGNRMIDNFALGNGTGFPDFYSDLQDISSLADDCSSNIWQGNTYGRAFPVCAGAGGHQIGSAQPKPDRPAINRVADHLGARRLPSP